MKIFLYYVGKARDEHANAIAAEFIKRSTRFANCEMREIHPEKFDPFTKHPSPAKVLLDPAGQSMTSAEFGKLFDRDLVFVIGGADGLPPEWKPRADALVSLTPMTLPHELARAMLAEQIYRALATRANHPYPR